MKNLIFFNLGYVIVEILWWCERIIEKFLVKLALTEFCIYFQLAQAIRLVIVYGGEELEEDLYEQGEGGLIGIFTLFTNINETYHFQKEIRAYTPLIFLKYQGKFWCIFMIID